MSTPQNSHHQCPCPHSVPQPPPPPAGDPPILAVGSCPVSYEVASFFPDPCVHNTLCAPSKSGVSVSPVLWNSSDHTPLAFKARFSGASSSHCQIPRLGSLMWGSEFSLLWENFCGIIIFQFVYRPPGGYGI